MQVNRLFKIMIVLLIHQFTLEVLFGFEITGNQRIYMYILYHLQSHFFSVTADQFCIKTQNNNISKKMLHNMQRNLMQIKHTHTLKH